MTNWPLIENWRSVIDKGEGLTHEQAQQMLKDMEWAVQKADDANRYRAHLGGGMNSPWSPSQA